MSLVDLMALEATYRNDKTAYENVVDELNYCRNPKKSKVNEAAQRNVDLQTSLLSISNVLPPSAVEHFSLLNEVKTLEEDYSKLVEDSGTVATMHHTRYVGWGVLAVFLFAVLVRQSLQGKSIVSS